MAHIPKINFTGSALATTVQTIINTRDQKRLRSRLVFQQQRL